MLKPALRPMVLMRSRPEVSKLTPPIATALRRPKTPASPAARSVKLGPNMLSRFIAPRAKSMLVPWPTRGV